MNKKDGYQYKNLKKAQDRKLKRLYDRVLYMLKTCNSCLFLTMTLTDKTIKTTSQKTRLRYIKNYLNEQATEYILNCDYGKANDREHYHAIIKPKYRKMVNYTAYKYGNIKAEIINKLPRFTRANKSLEEVAKSLTEHATKNTTKDTKIIYSRALRKRTEPSQRDTDFINQRWRQIEHNKEMDEIAKMFNNKTDNYLN